MNLELWAGVGLIMLAASLSLVLGLMRKHMSSLPLRDLPAINHLKKSAGLTIENGKRLHVSLGSSSILGSGNAASLAGLSMVEHLALLSMISDRPPVVTAGEGSLLVLGQDTLRYVYRKGNILEKYNPLLARQTGFSPYSFVLGTMPVIARESVQTSVLTGRFGPEAAFICDAARRGNGYALGASDDLTAQAVMFAAANDVLIGEELFAAPAYLSQSPFHKSSLLTQDILRWILIAVILGGVILVVLSQFIGYSIL